MSRLLISLVFNEIYVRLERRVQFEIIKPIGAGQMKLFKLILIIWFVEMKKIYFQAVDKDAIKVWSATAAVKISLPNWRELM